MKLEKGRAGLSASECQIPEQVLWNSCSQYSKIYWGCRLLWVAIFLPSKPWPWRCLQDRDEAPQWSGTENHSKGTYGLSQDPWKTELCNNLILLTILKTPLIVSFPHTGIFQCCHGEGSGCHLPSLRWTRWAAHCPGILAFPLPSSPFSLFPSLCLSQSPSRAS